MLFGVKARAQSYDTWSKRVSEALAADQKSKKGTITSAHSQNCVTFLASVAEVTKMGTKGTTSPPRTTSQG